MDMEDGSAGGLPTKQDEEFRPFIRRLPEFKFWHAATRAVAIGFVCSWFEVFNVPVFWPVLVMYWIILFVLTSKFLSTLQEAVLSGCPWDWTMTDLSRSVRKQIQHMIKYKYVPFSLGKAKYGKPSSS